MPRAQGLEPGAFLHAPPQQQARPTVNPAPTDTINTQVAALQPRCLRSASFSASGMVAAVVLPNRSTLITTFSTGTAELFRRRQDDAAVGLVRDERGRDDPALAPLRSSRRRARFLGVPHRKLEHRLPVLLHVVEPLVDGVVRRRAEAAAARHAQRRAAAAVHLVTDEVDDADALAVRGRRDHAAPAPSPKMTQVGAIGVVDDARHHVGADDERVLRCAPVATMLARRRQRVGEAGAGRAQVEAPGVGGTDGVLHAGRRVLGNIMSGVTVPTTMKPI